MLVKRSTWRRALLPVAGVLLTGIATATFVAVQRRVERASYETACDTRTLAIRRNLETNLMLLRALQAYARAGTNHDWGSMNRFVANFTPLGKDVARYYWWNPRISPRAAQPLQPYPEDSARVEFNTAAMHRLIQDAAVGDSSQLLVLAGDRPLCLAGLAVEHPGGLGEEGVVLAFDVAKLMEDALSVVEPLGINVELRDERGRLLYRHAARLRRRAGLLRLFQPNPRRWVRTSALAFAGTNWRLRFQPIDAYLSPLETVTSVGVPVCGLLITVLLSILWDRWRRESAAAKELAELRARQLRKTQGRLQQELLDKASVVASLRRSEDRFQRAYLNAAIGMMVADTQGRLLQVNQAVCRFTGYTEQELIGHSFLSLLGEAERQDAIEKSSRLFSGHLASYVAQRHFRRKDGREVWLRTSACRIENEAGSASLLALMEDISGEMEAQKQLHYQATHDVLTGLFNRRAFEAELARVVKRAQSAGSAIVLMYLDLDGFKFINDSLGHGIGDLLLPAVGERLGGCLPDSARLARVGGDEFTILLNETADPAAIEALATRLLDCLQAPFMVNGYELFVSASIGICRYPQDGRDPTTLVQHADTAMYQAKRDGKSRYCYFTAEMAAAAHTRLELERDLRHALDRGEFEVHFQPLVRHAAGALVSFEALCRWRHPTRGYIPPEQFIPVAEDTGLIIPIGQWVMQEACRRAVIWNTLVSPIRVAVNVSVVQLTQARFVHEVSETLEQTGLPANLLELELTESAVMQNTDSATRMLRELRELGVSIALDDFGTGYSSLSRLRVMPLDILKIDRSFVRDLTYTQASQRLVASLITLAHGIGLRVVSEGVESPEQAEILQALGCDVVQGFLFGRPLTHQDAYEYVVQASGNRTSADLAALARAIGMGVPIPSPMLQ